MKRISAAELLSLANIAYWAKNKDKILLDYTNYEMNRLTSDELLLIADQSYYATTKDTIVHRATLRLEAELKRK